MKLGLYSIILSGVLLFATDTSFAQAVSSTNGDTTFLRTRRTRPKPIKRELSGGLRLNSDGWSLFMDRGTVKSEDRKSDLFYDIVFWQVEFGEKKHPMEIKRTNALGAAVESTTPFIYGKISNFYTFKLGYGKRKMIAGKPDPGTVSIHWVYLGGLSLGLEKPYYIDAFLVSKGGIQESINYTDTTKEDFLNQNAIIGSSGITKGINEVKFVPGIHGKTALHFDFASSKKTKLAIETGVNVEVYTRAIELMANQDSVPYFVNVYASFQVGKRWPEKKKKWRR